MDTLDLGGLWTLEAREGNTRIPAVVPGTVLGALLDAGLLADPFVADQEFAACAETRKAWTYRRTFEVSLAFLDRETVVLVAEGLMTLAEIVVNGRLVGAADNMHRHWTWDLRPFLHEGSNDLEVRFSSSLVEAEARQRATPTWSVNGVPGFQHLRQSHHTFGWDWGPALPDLGIFRPLRIEAWDGPRLDQVSVRQNHRAGGVDLEVRVTLERPSGSPLPVLVRLTAPSGSAQEVRGTLAVGTAEIRLNLSVTDPLLWWPAGLGAQPLYRLEVTAGPGQERRRCLRLGLRTLTVVQRDDQWGRSFALAANGVEFFARGADYIPEDNLIGRIDPARTAQLLDDCLAAHFNCLRVWGGGYYPDDAFYDLCDDRGLVVWQDMLFACALYAFTPEFRASIEAETRDNVRRLRHHACLALWCGNNEMEQAIVEWAIGESPEQRLEYLEVYESMLPELVRQEDPDRFYWPASPSSFGGFDRPNSQDYGDMHDWSIWHGRAPFTDYRKRYPRFMSEFGLQSYPSAKTLGPCIPAQERNPFSYLMELREKHSAGIAPLFHYLQQEFRIPSGFENHLLVSQFVQAEGVRTGVEHWRRHRGRCMGAVIWQLNDCWPGISWSSIDYAGRWKVLHYAARRFFAPVLLSACESGSRVTLHVTNDTLDGFAGQVSWRLRTTEGQVLRSGTQDCRVPALSAQTVADLDFSREVGVPPVTEASRRTFLQFALVGGEGRVSSGVCLFVPSKHFQLKDPRLAVRVRGEAGTWSISLEGRSLARFVFLDFEGFDAVFDDNGFDLPPGEVRSVTIREFRGAVPVDAATLEKALRVTSLWDTWTHDQASAP